MWRARSTTRAYTFSIKDGLKYIRRIEDEYDLIIIDSTDPFGPGEGLFTMEFYGNCYKALKEHGVLVNQHESPFYKGDALACQRAHRNIVHSFELSRLFSGTYPDVSVRTLAVRLFVARRASGARSESGLVEQSGTGNQILQYQSA